MVVVPPSCIEAEVEETTTSLSQKKTIHQKQFFRRSYRIKKKMVMICMAAAAVMVHIECERGSRSDYYTTLHILYYVIVENRVQTKWSLFQIGPQWMPTNISKDKITQHCLYSISSDKHFTYWVSSPSGWRLISINSRAKADT